MPENYLPITSTTAQSAPTALTADEIAYTADTDDAASSTSLVDTDDAGIEVKTENAGEIESVVVDKPDKDILSMRSLHASIEQEGILLPLFVKPAAENGFYEILSGYRRKRVCEVLSKTNPAFSSVPVIVVEPCDDDTASSIITSSNVQRREISFLETIKSCGQMYRALRHRGKKNEEGSVTASVVSQILGLKPRTVQRYSQLLELPDRMLELVGTKAKNADGTIRLPIGAGEVLSSLNNKEKLAVIEEVLMDNSKNEHVVITVSTAKAIRKACNLKEKITRKEIEGVILKSQQE